MSAPLDPRIHVYRDDLAAAPLRGRVEARRFVAGTARQVSAGIAPLRGAPAAEAEQASELLFGEVFTVYDEKAGWAWGQAAADGYVGYLEAAHLAEPLAPTHLVTDPRAFLRPEPRVQAAPLATLPMGARLAIAAIEGDHARLAGGGFVATRHLTAGDAVEPDHAATAERLLDAPYLWGGRSALGIDCSGLVQIALQRAGHRAPRDSDMQECLGAPVPDGGPSTLRRGDLVFWRGHCAIVLDAERLIHANAGDMRVAITPLGETLARYERTLDLPVRAFRRMPRP
jgi:cell wall-associated NlpC family hydrolase